ncbi:MAG: ExeM/NucH family extracellular endonuclease [Chloroflexota bacterium]|nr:ExeM/NucH family extracellular endonuclease [Chloroflexota bacterium]
MISREKKKHFIPGLFALTLIFSLIAMPVSTVAAQDGRGDPVINEFVFNHTGTDTHEFVEILGAVSTDYAGLTIVEIEGDSASAGLIDDGIFDLGITDAAGYWTTGYLENLFENGTVTLLLVENFTGSVGDDLDTDNDCVLDSTPWDRVVDDIAVYDGGSSDCTYAGTVLAGGFDGNSYTPGGASRIPNGTDTNTAADWMRNDWDGAGFPGWSGSPSYGEAYNTAGSENVAVPESSETCGDEYIPIYDIQGDGDESPIVGEVVSTEGVVTGEFQGSDQLKGFFVQDAVGDGNPATSDGIFVYYNDLPVKVGDSVRVRGTVREYYGKTQLSYVSDMLTCGVGFSVAPTPASMPVAEVSDLEPLEGMLITFPQALYASDVYNVHRYGEVVISANNRQFTPTNYMAPGPDAGDSNGNSVADVNETGRLTLDDGSNSQFPDVVPYIAADGTLRMGDTVTNLTGNLDYSYSIYRMQPTAPVIFERVNHRTSAPDDVGSIPGVIKVATFNLWNYWTTIDDGENNARGADSDVEFERQKAKTVPAILEIGADIIGLQELENNGDVAVASLVEALNAATAPGTWNYVLEPPGVAGTNAIKVSIIYQTAKVTPVGDSIADDDPIYDRPPVAQTFDASGEIFTVVSNHFKSKGCYDETGLDEDQGDGQSCYNYKRTLQAEAMLTFADELIAASGDNDLVVVGDYNSYAMEDPIVKMETGLLNLSDMYTQAGDDYSYVFYGQAGQLDYIFTSDELAARVTGLDIWHMSADEPRVLDYNDEVIDPGETYRDFSHDYLYVQDQYRSSDHDAVIAGFCEAVPPELDVEVASTSLARPNIDFKLVEMSVTATDNADPNPTIELVSVTTDMPNWPPLPGTVAPIIPIDEFTFLLKWRHWPWAGDAPVYTITYRATDACGNATEVSVDVTAEPLEYQEYLAEFAAIDGNSLIYLPMLKK